jgi:hypothetical protein
MHLPMLCSGSQERRLDQRQLFWARFAGILTLVSIGIALLDYLDGTPVPVRIVSDPAKQIATIAEAAAPPPAAVEPAPIRREPRSVLETSRPVAEPRVDTRPSTAAPVQKQAVSRPANPQSRPPRQVAIHDFEPRPVEIEREIQPVHGTSLEFPHVAQ